MKQENDIDYMKRLEAALLEYVEKYGPTEAAKAAFRDAPQISRTDENPASWPEGSMKMKGDRTD